MVAAAAAASAVEAMVKGIVMVFSRETGDACTSFVMLWAYDGSVLTECLRQIWIILLDRGMSTAVWLCSSSPSPSLLSELCPPFPSDLYPTFRSHLT